VTYRIYDYGRGRELHVDRALDVIDYELKSPLIKGEKIEKDDHTLLRYIGSKYFTVEKIISKNEYKSKSDVRKYFIFICIEGNGEIVYDDGNKSEAFEKSESVLIPATLGEFCIKGTCEFLKVYV
jgi:mannose-6-phosphate isomerase